jgi:peptide/nickel transport system permease protein
MASLQTSRSMTTRPAPAPPDPSRRELRRALRIIGRPATAIAIVVLVGIVLLAALAPALAPYDPASQSLAGRLRPPLSEVAGRPHLLGTDQLGRDVLARLIYGSRVSLVVGVASVAVSGAIGVLVGLVAGYFGGVADTVLMRVADVLMAFPFILLALAIIAVLGPSLPNIVLVFGLTSWVVYARTVRALALSLRDREFVLAARALGAGHPRLLFRHVAPMVLSPVIVVVSFELARIVVSEAALTFLGVGIPASIPSWGSMINDGRQYIQTAWWIAIFPGLALLLLVVAVSLLGDALRDVLDPRAGW